MEVFIKRFQNTLYELYEYSGVYLFDGIVNLFKSVISFGYFTVFFCLLVFLPVWSIPANIIQNKRQKDGNTEFMKF